MNLLRRNIFLIGYMGCGKSTVARELNLLCKVKIVEMDQMIADQEGSTIPEIFATRGEEYFRRCETALLRKLKDGGSAVISCGGGVATRPENVALMKERGYIVLLTARPETILQRILRSDDRPLLEGKKNVGDIAAMMRARRSAYEQAADIVIETDGISAAITAEKILARCQSCS